MAAYNSGRRNEKQLKFLLCRIAVVDTKGTHCFGECICIFLHWEIVIFNTHYMYSNWLWFSCFSLLFLLFASTVCRPLVLRHYYWFNLFKNSSCYGCLWIFLSSTVLKLLNLTLLNDCKHINISLFRLNFNYMFTYLLIQINKWNIF